MDDADMLTEVINAAGINNTMFSMLVQQMDHRIKELSEDIVDTSAVMEKLKENSIMEEKLLISEKEWLNSRDAAREDLRQQYKMDPPVFPWQIEEITLQNTDKDPSIPSRTEHHCELCETMGERRRMINERGNNSGDDHE